jgi:hypothetical protein
VVDSSWISVASLSTAGLFYASPCVPTFNLVGAPHKPVYSASCNLGAIGSQELDVLEVTGLSIGQVHSVSSRITKAKITDDSLRMLGWTGSLDNGVPDSLLRTLVANRTHDGHMLPGWFRRACALAIASLYYGDLDIPKLLADTSQPSTMIEYLERVKEAIHNRRLFQIIPCIQMLSNSHFYDAAGMEIFGMGMGPGEMQSGNMVCILFGCSVPVVLRKMDGRAWSEPQNVKLTGEAYVHDNMEGEALTGLARKEVERSSVTFRID